jgi:hypothetical protein
MGCGSFGPSNFLGPRTRFKFGQLGTRTGYLCPPHGYLLLKVLAVQTRNRLVHPDNLAFGNQTGFHPTRHLETGFDVGHLDVARYVDRASGIPRTISAERIPSRDSRHQ